MKKSRIFIILFAATLAACNSKQSGNETTNKTMGTEMNNENFKKTVNHIKTSDIYENSENWNARGLNPSDESVILILRKATNDFLDKLDEIYDSNEPSETKLDRISKLVDQLPWEELDTEEKEFLTDTLAPAIEAAGFDPWAIF